MVRRDEAHPTHVGSERIHMLDALRGLEAALPPTKVEQAKLIGIALGVFRMLDVNAANPVALPLQEGNQMMADKTAGPGDENLRSHCGCHATFLSVRSEARAPLASTAGA